MALAACGQAAGDAAALTAAATAERTSLAAGSATASVDSPASTVAASTTSEALTSQTSTGAPGSATSAAPTSSAAAAATAASATTASAAAAAKGVTLTINPAGTVGSYQVQEQLAGHNFPSQAVGKTSAVSGAIVLDAVGKLVASASKLELDLRTLKSDRGMRDNYIQRDPLDTAEYPMATFVPSAATGLPWPLPATGTAKFSLAGDMTIHGTTKPLTWAVTATFAPDNVTGTATTPFTFTDFGMQPPRTMIALSVNDGGTLTLQFTATRAAR